MRVTLLHRVAKMRGRHHLYVVSDMRHLLRFIVMPRFAYAHAQSADDVDFAIRY